MLLLKGGLETEVFRRTYLVATVTDCMVPASAETLFAANERGPDQD